VTFTLHGIGVSRGVGIGRAHIIEHADFQIREILVPRSEIEAEIQRLRGAVQTAKQDLRAVREQIPTTTAPDIANFIDTHLLMLEDAAITFDSERLIEARGCNAEWALKMRRDALVKVFDEMDDPYLRTRKDDVDHVVTRIQRILANHEQKKYEMDGNHLADIVVVTDELSPADAILMKKNGVAAFVTRYGGATSHMSILVRSLGIPGIVGVHGIHQYISEKELLIVDGDEGVVVADPDTVSLSHYRGQQSERRRHAESLEHLREVQAITSDGVEIELHANVELPGDFVAAQNVGATGVGLYRTEFLYVNRNDIPNEEEHFRAYRELINSVQGLPVTIRTLDMGADDDITIEGSRMDGANPALGLRAIRLSLTQPEAYWSQLRAIIRSSAFGPVRLLIPMLSNVSEGQQVISDIRTVQTDLERRHVAFDPKMLIGAMIEVPAAAICADAFARIFDFFSIGTNDLIQYTVAIDRLNNSVNHLYDPLHPAVLRLIAGTIDAAQARKIPVAMCGEMAGDVSYTRLLLALGLRQFSVNPSVLLEIKHIVAQTNVAEIEHLARTALSVSDLGEFKTLLEKLR